MTPKFQVCHSLSPAPLQDLPPELVEAVASLLEPTDLCALRMTCRTIYNKTYHVFWRTSLQNIQTDLSHSSLTKLDMLSNNPELCCYVHRLTFKEFDENNLILGEGLDWNRHSPGHLIDLQEQPAAKLLRPILSRLVNCKSFECCSISTPDHLDLEDAHRATDAVQLILDIVAETRLPVASFSVNFRDHYETGCVYLDPSRLHLGYFKKPGFVDKWAHLGELNLDFTPDFEILNWATDLILLAPNVKKLNMRLDIDNNTFILMRRLASTESLVWPRLQELRLGRNRSPLADLTALLDKCKQTLRVLHIRMLTTDATVSDLGIFFETLNRIFPCLEDIGFGPWFSRPRIGIQRLSAVHCSPLLENLDMDETEKAKVDVAYEDHYGERTVRSVAYSGPQVHAVLDSLARSVDLL